jgi:hypothetical protein
MECVLDMNPENIIGEAKQSLDLRAEAKLFWQPQRTDSVEETHASAPKMLSASNTVAGEIAYLTVKVSPSASALNLPLASGRVKGFRMLLHSSFSEMKVRRR